MKDTIVYCIEQSFDYDVLDANDKSVLITSRTHGNEGEILLHTKPMTIDDYNSRVRSNLGDYRATASVFLKDGNNWYVPLDGKFTRKSIRGHSEDARSKMVHLRDLEKRVMESQGNGVLVYFDPETELLKGYEMRAAKLNYDHLNVGDRGLGYAKNKYSKDFFIPYSQFEHKGPVQFEGRAVKTIVPARVVQQNLFE